jgi:hypothetical protein
VIGIIFHCSLLFKNNSKIVIYIVSCVRKLKTLRGSNLPDL